MIPPPSDPCWQRFISRGAGPEFEALATRIVHSRARQLAESGFPESREAAIRLVHGYFTKNERVLGADLRVIVGAREVPDARLLTREATCQLIASGARLLLAGEAALLEGLPTGPWIGGSIPYFMTAGGAP